MVISKRCKICTTLDANNIPISGECFGKQIPDLVVKISGVELDVRKLNGVLICQQCSIMLVHTEGVIDKLRKSLQRLAYTKKAQRTASKQSCKVVADTPKNSTKIKLANANGDTAFRKIIEEPKSLDGSALITEKETPTKSAKRKLEYQEQTVTNEAVKSGSLTKKSKLKSQPSSVENSFTEVSKYNGQTMQISNNSMSMNNENAEEKDMYNVSVDEDSSKQTKDLNCVLCEKKFNQKRTLRQHIESCHMGEKLKECPNCFMEFRSVQKYESHVFSEKCKTTLHPCQFENCHRRFKNVYRMEEHMKEKHFSTNDAETD